MKSRRTTNFLDVTELIGDEISQEQLERLMHRYFWAGSYCKDRDVLEVACGCGSGLRYLATEARSVKAGDYSPEILARARAHLLDAVELRVFDAQEMPFADESFDVVLICEALYYIPSPDRFVREARRVLRPNGTLLIVNSNKDLFDFNPSPHSVVYHGVVELRQLLEAEGFRPSFLGYLRVTHVSLRQRLLRPVKKAAVMLGLIPKTMAGKKFLKRLVFGRMTRMPEAIVAGMVPYSAPEAIPADIADRAHKIIYCAAKKSGVEAVEFYPHSAPDRLEDRP